MRIVRNRLAAPRRWQPQRRRSDAAAPEPDKKPILEYVGWLPAESAREVYAYVPAQHPTWFSRQWLDSVVHVRFTPSHSNEPNPNFNTQLAIDVRELPVHDVPPLWLGHARDLLSHKTAARHLFIGPERRTLDKIYVFVDERQNLRQPTFEFDLAAGEILVDGTERTPRRAAPRTILKFGITDLPQWSSPPRQAVVRCPLFDRIDRWRTVERMHPPLDPLKKQMRRLGWWVEYDNSESKTLSIEATLVPYGYHGKYRVELETLYGHPLRMGFDANATVEAEMTRSTGVLSIRNFSRRGFWPRQQNELAVFWNALPFGLTKHFHFTASVNAVLQDWRLKATHSRAGAVITAQTKSEDAEIYANFAPSGRCLQLQVKTMGQIRSLDPPKLSHHEMSPFMPVVKQIAALLEDSIGLSPVRELMGSLIRYPKRKGWTKPLPEDLKGLAWPEPLSDAPGQVLLRSLGFRVATQRLVRAMAESGLAGYSQFTLGFLLTQPRFTGLLTQQFTFDAFGNIEMTADAWPTPSEPSYKIFTNLECMDYDAFFTRGAEGDIKPEHARLTIAKPKDGVLAIERIVDANGQNVAFADLPIERINSEFAAHMIERFRSFEGGLLAISEPQPGFQMKPPGGVDEARLLELTEQGFVWMHPKPGRWFELLF